MGTARAIVDRLTVFTVSFNRFVQPSRLTVQSSGVVYIYTYIHVYFYGNTKYMKIQKIYKITNLQHLQKVQKIQNMNYGTYT